MKTAAVMSLSLVAAASARGSPIGKIIEMLGSLEQKIIAEGDASQKAYEEVSEFCSDRQKEMGFEVKTGQSNKEELQAVISKAAADIEELDARVADLAASSAKADKDLKEATALRKKEAADFSGIEADLVATIDTLERASGIISRQINKGSFAQLSGVSGLTTAVKLLVQGYSINTADGKKLTALLQSYSTSEASSDEEDEEDDDASGAPSAAAYENQSDGILDLLTDLQTKAEDELSSARDGEAKSQHNYDLTKQALTDELKFASADLDESKKSKAANEEKKAAAEGDLAAMTKDLSQDLKTLGELHRHCMSKSADFEAETATRGEELKALATAKKIIKEATGSSLAQVSFLQIENEARKAVGLTAVHKIRALAVADHSKGLARLASRMEALLQRHGANPFGKIKGMISTMISKLEAEAESSASEKAFCDKALAENNEKKDDSTTALEKLTVKIEQGVSAAEQLREEVTVLQSELAKLMSAQMSMDKMRAEESAVYKASKAENEKALTGIQTALKVLRDYYAKDKDSSNQGAAGGIVSLLEVCETDFTQGLAEIKAVEEDAQAEYDSETKDNELTKVVKNKDVEFKGKEIASLEKTGTELKSDAGAVQAELDAINQSLASLQKQCIAKAESYESKVSKQKAEIEGLKAALESLGSASLLQRTHKLRHTTLKSA